MWLAPTHLAHENLWAFSLASLYPGMLFSRCLPGPFISIRPWSKSLPPPQNLPSYLKLQPFQQSQCSLVTLQLIAMMEYGRGNSWVGPWEEECLWKGWEKLILYLHLFFDSFSCWHGRHSSKIAQL